MRNFINTFIIVIIASYSTAAFSITDNECESGRKTLEKFVATGRLTQTLGIEKECAIRSIKYYKISVKYFLVNVSMKNFEKGSIIQREYSKISRKVERMIKELIEWKKTMYAK